MIKNVFFDVDDTLISFRRSKPIAFREMFEERGYPFDEELVVKTFESINIPLWESLERGEISGTELRRTRWPRVMRALSLPEGGDMELEDAFRLALSHTTPLEDGAKELFKYLKEKGYKIYIASNSCQWQQESRMEKSGLAEFLDGIYCSQIIGHEKPYKEFFDAVLEKAGAKAEESMMVGDSITADVGGGKNAGLTTCWYNPNGKEDTVGADYVINSLLDITKIL